MNRPMPLFRHISDARSSVEVLENATRSWRAPWPPRFAIDTAIVQADAIARGLRELRLAMDEDDTPPGAA
jgi:hypothetical protein